MTNSLAKRFWTTTGVQPRDGGYGITLDDRPVRTPAKTPLVLPSRALAGGIAREWDAQQGKIDPSQMPLTRSANSAIDKVATQIEEVAAMLTAYGDADLLCYRAENPAELVRKQAQGWDPLLDWAAETLQVRLEPRTGVMHKSQEKGAIERLGRLVRGFDAFELAGFHDLVALSGSLIIGFVAERGAMPLDQLWEISRIDEAWQTSQWGVDDENARQTGIKHQAFLDAAEFIRLLRA